MSGQLAPEFRRDYILGGHAVVTLVSKRTGDRFTYRVSVSKPKPGDTRSPVHFVNVLTGPNNQQDYKFLGTIFPDGTFRRSGKSQIGADAPSARAWEWTWTHLDGPEADRVEVWHEGACARCGKPLTDPASIERGLGPVCAERAEGL